ncbi:MAG: phosphodiester glycosidase family protein [Advenella sp.]|uniref:phosphodiester glycosidase family protein n=1 Tax=Advenella sp. S44 TaxID=1982755 RepID=UPI00137471DF|nr:phosphodiester glycosidase family protein [Advenella sp. S44]
MKTLLAALTGWCLGALVPAMAQTTEQVSPCIAHTTKNNAHVHIVKVDLSCPSIQLVGTAVGTAPTTVKNFAYRNRLNVAINASFFDPQYRPQGLVISDGQRWSNTRDTRQHAFLACTAENRCLIDAPNHTAKVNAEWHTVIAGWQNLRSGTYICARGASASCYSNARAAHPRTSVGLSPDRRWLYIIVVEGRLTGFEGFTLNQLARLYRSLGVRDAINLDGGSSTTLVINNTRMNVLPSRQLFLERSVANQFGVRDTSAR